MTRLLEETIDKLRELPAAEQDSIATLVLAELESERQWDALFEKSAASLAERADQAWAEHEAGKSELLDPDKL